MDKIYKHNSEICYFVFDKLTVILCVCICDLGTKGRLVHQYDFVLIKRKFILRNKQNPVSKSPHKNVFISLGQAATQ